MRHPSVLLAIITIWGSVLGCQATPLAGTQPALNSTETATLQRWTARPLVLTWNEFLRARMTFHRHKVYPPRTARNYAIMNTAMLQALEATTPLAAPGTGFGILAGLTTTAPAPEAAAACAAAAVVNYVLPEESTTAKNMAAEVKQALLWSGRYSHQAVTAGEIEGQKAAAKLITLCQSDGADEYGPIPAESNQPLPAERNGGLWTHPVPIEPHVRLWRPWGLTSPSQFRLPAPPRPGDPIFEAEFQEVLDVSKRLTTEEEKAADRFAATAPPSDWNVLALESIEAHGLDNLAAARLLSYWGQAQADAAIACWDSKYHWFQIRPHEEARRRDPASIWWPYLITTPAHPSYPSGHSTFSGAAEAFLGRAFPADKAKFENFADTMSQSRLWGGIHFRSDNVDGLKLGRQVGNLHADAWEKSQPQK